MAVATFVNSLGGGMFTSTSALYFTRVVGLPAVLVAIGLLSGSLAGLVSGVFAGRAADRWGPRRTQTAVMGCGGAAISGFLLVRSFWPFLLVSVLSGAVLAADRASKAPLIRSLAGHSPTYLRSHLRSVTNLALALGAVAGGFAVQFNTRPAYLLVMAGRAAAYLACGLVMRRLPRRAPTETEAARRGLAALRDRPYLSATAANAIMSLHFAVPTFLLPLWIVDHTDAPRWTVSGALILNTAMVIVLQVRVSRAVSDPASAGQRMLWTGVAFLAGLGLMSLAGRGAPWAATLLLACGTVAYTLGELWHAAAATEYSFGLAPAHLQGQYAGVFGLGSGVADAAAPAVMTALPLTLGRPGWLLLGGVFLLVGIGCRPLLAWASRGRTGLPDHPAARSGDSWRVRSQEENPCRQSGPR